MSTRFTKKENYTITRRLLVIAQITDFKETAKEQRENFPP